MEIAIVATSLLLATAIPATAGHYGGDGGTNWGAVAGAGILGALLGAAAVPQPQPQQTIIVTPSPAPPTIYLWCAPLGRFYGQIATCPGQWQPVQVQR
jgi:hypothetical protein